MPRRSTEIYTYPNTSYSLTNKYVTDHGYAQLPLAGPQASPTADTCAIVRLHAGVCKRVLAIEAVRAGKHPTLPTLAAELVDPSGIREVLISTEIDTSAPQIEADQASRSFAIRAIYTYALSRPPTPQEKLRAGSIPMDATAPESNSVLLSAVTDADAHLQWEPPV
ncbi:hypothetical protein [Candidatus Laterigemmans baculatus]|uniref:hypothetical protein n=1 Tax=Candidatus Laterigemmans baculatus TaxID=2770505 RepID=UPI0013DC13B3|nr:hypothetical protein [Candidatus Laterigemmans baculatus]